MTHSLVNHHITGHLVFVLVSTGLVTKWPAIDSSASSEIRTIIRRFHAKGMSAAVYGQNVTREGTYDNGVEYSKMGEQMLTGYISRTRIISPQYH